MADLKAKITADANDLLENTVMKLIFDEPFYANLTLNMRRIITTELPTLGVNVTDEVNLYINPFFFKSLSPEERVEVLKHECHHVMNNHFVRFRDLEPKIYDKDTKKSMDDRVKEMQNASLLNQAADYAINEYLPKLPKKMHIFKEDGTPIIEGPTKPDGSPNPEEGKAMTTGPLL